MRALMWFRSDLRVVDNAALHHACRVADDGVVAIFLLASDQWREHDWADVKVEFLLRNLRSLSEELADKNIALLIRSASRFDEAPQAILDTCREHQCDAVFFNREYEVNECHRDVQVASQLKQQQIAVHTYHDQVYIRPGSLLTGEDRFYSVFSPFRRALFARLDEDGLPPAHRRPRTRQAMIGEPDAVPKTVSHFDSNAGLPDLWPAGERHAEQRLKQFIENRARRYKDSRDFPADDTTSRMSPYLALGIISPRQCLHAAVDANNGKLHKGCAGLDTWISELIWREFYRHIVVGYPRVSMSQPFRTETRDIVWRNSDEDFAAWCDGRTGFPIVDAGMRQLKAEGWMHNRVRMITAMFLTKDLLLDWRLGEQHFMRHLIDGDLASNNGGWQWSASTGTDAAPYFRIFNPTTQSEKFDPTGAYIKTHVPELASLTGRSLHDPGRLDAQSRAALDYPQPIVDHAQARDRAIAAFDALKKTT